MKVYRIKNWDECFETSESRKRRTGLEWVAIPTKHDGKGFRRLMRDHGIAVYGAWVLICAVAAKCPLRGVLADTDGPLSAEDIADKTDCPVDTVRAALEACSSDRVGWIELVDVLGIQQIDAQSAAKPAEASRSQQKPVLQDQTGPDRTKPSTGGAGDLISGFGAGSGKSTSVFAKLTVEDLADDAVLEDWFQFASVRARRPLFANSESNRLNVFSAAERALEFGDDPLKLFKHIVGKQKWELITSDQEDCARKRLLRLRRAAL